MSTEPTTTKQTTEEERQQMLPGVEVPTKRRKNSVTIGLSDDGVTLAKILNLDQEELVSQLAEKAIKEMLAQIREQVKLPF